ncbi:hypothetical protein GCM10010472_04170 [Pseudonocardia halophobica]|uniref:Uncharacterized protein n=1 Tax=Pseudonocardia halophobica TaxID=29401 RepID=A0A9W6NY47_9PSEU|nr:hypothetical protein [Pseudonocardia halophobica]GLL13376.1 hypothetical protein GCM10017577_45190 [Pseudonocardia halophobica]
MSRLDVTLADLDHVRVGIEVSLTPWNAPLLVAIRAGLDVAELRHQRRHDLIEASHAISAALDWRWVATSWTPHDLLVERRKQPGWATPRLRAAALEVGAA